MPFNIDICSNFNDYDVKQLGNGFRDIISFTLERIPFNGLFPAFFSGVGGGGGGDGLARKDNLVLDCSL